MGGKDVTGNHHKKIVVFFDGTWNRADQKTFEGRACPTNITKLFEATVHFNNKDDCPQIVRYIQGVGNRRFERLLGGGFGFGISDTIKEGYSFLISNYEKGDDIYVFGFSRGAFAARSLVGLIRNLGILKREKLYLVNEAYKKYKDKSEPWGPDGDEAVQFREQHTWKDEKIRFLGVFDTVGALGAPFGVVLGWIVDKIFRCTFHNTKLSSMVTSAYHALAIDEKRLPFQPTLMNSNKKHNPANFEQKWFPGAHSDVGGGLEDTGLSDVALTWMAEKAANHGLELDLRRVSNPPVHPNTDKAPDPSQTIFYQIGSTLFVKLPGQIGVVAKKYREALPYIQWNGDYIRPIARPGNVTAFLGTGDQVQNLNQYDGDLDLSTIKKISEQRDSYRPRNVFKRAESTSASSEQSI